MFDRRPAQADKVKQDRVSRMEIKDFMSIKVSVYSMRSPLFDGTFTILSLS